MVTGLLVMTHGCGQKQKCATQLGHPVRGWAVPLFVSIIDLSGRLLSNLSLPLTQHKSWAVRINNNNVVGSWLCSLGD